MATIGDAIKQFVNDKAMCDLFGCTEEWAQKVAEATKKIAAAIMEERGISQKEAIALPHDTVLGPKAEAAYQEFVTLLEGEQAKKS